MAHPRLLKLSRTQLRSRLTTVGANLVRLGCDGAWRWGIAARSMVGTKRL